MNMNMKVYLSHRISDKDPRVTALRCKRAVHFGTKLRNEFIDARTRFGEKPHVTLDIYVPGGATETFVSRAYKTGILTVDQILDVDCQIIRDADAVILFDPEFGTKGCETLSHGCQAEWDYAVKHHKPIYMVVCDDCYSLGNAAAFLAGVASESCQSAWIQQVTLKPVTCDKSGKVTTTV